MIPSQTCIDFIKKEELFESRSYKDSAGIWTIGYGSILHKNGTPVIGGEIITVEEATELLMIEVNAKSNKVNACLHDITVTQSMFDALVSFAYNEGTGAFQNSTLLLKVRNNPNNQTMIAFANAHTSTQNYMQKHGLGEINIIHNEFMQWVFVANPVTHQKEISSGLQGRRNREYQLYTS